MKKVFITTRDTGPEGWEVTPLDDTNVFAAPDFANSTEFLSLLEKAKNGDVDPLMAIADFDI